MRVGHVIQSASHSVGGPSASTFALCNALHRSGCNCAIACGVKDSGEQPGLDSKIEISVFNIRRSPFSGRAEKDKLARFIRAADVIHLHGLWDALPYIAAGLSRKLGKPYVLSLHGMLLERSLAHHRLRKRLFLSLAGNRVLRGAAAIHFTTKAELEQATSVLPDGPERLVIPLTIESSLIDNPPNASLWTQYFPQLPNSWPRLLFLSRIHPVKNLPALLAALPPLVREFPGLHLVIAGGGDPSYVRKMEALASSSSLAKAFFFVGPISGESKAALICSSTVMAIPSFHENFGMAIAEGLACSVPTIVTPGLGIGAEILACGAGFPCGEDADSIAESLATFLRQPEWLANAGKNGRQWVLRTLSASSVAGQFNQLYARLANDPVEHPLFRSARGDP